MKILFTGASSHTGYWFVKELVAAGHYVTITLRKKPEEYEGIRKERVFELIKLANPVYGASFGDDTFVDLVRNGSWDLFCHHAAEVTNYRSPEYDPINALKQNANNLPKVLDALKLTGCNHVLLSGSKDEHNEGKGTVPLEAFGPYWLAKEFTWELFRYYAKQKDINLGKFVIPNPFGPMEDPKFTTYLVQCWYRGEIPTVKTPSYIRDNVNVTLLAFVYRDFAEKLITQTGVLKVSPSQYVGLQGDFAAMFASQLEQRLHIPCRLSMVNQLDFPEPLERVNTDPIDHKRFNWDEKKAWDDLANFYHEHYSK